MALFTKETARAAAAKRGTKPPKPGKTDAGRHETHVHVHHHHYHGTGALPPPGKPSKAKERD